MRNFYIHFIKPLTDKVLALILLLLALPLFVVVIILLWQSTHGKAFFTQKRPGKNARIFKLIKFRTMREAFDEKGNPLPDKDRITPIGKVIRSSSIDELPQLINVLKGDMSLIGPRPLLVKYLPLYSEEQARRHEVKPGITGWAQVNGRNSLSWEDKFNMDVWYVENVSFKLDIKILLKTIVKVITNENVNSSKTKTMEPFKGDK